MTVSRRYPDVDVADLARRLSDALAKDGTSPAFLADALGVSARTVRRWLDPSHPAVPSPAKRRVLETLLGLPFGAFDGSRSYRREET